MEHQINELVVDDPELMALDTPQKVYILGQLVMGLTTDLNEEFPEINHMVIVRVGQWAN